MTPLALAAVVALVAVAVYALIVLVRIATTEPEPERAPRHLDTGDPAQHRIASTSPQWLRETYQPRHLLARGAG